MLSYQCTDRNIDRLSSHQYLLLTRDLTISPDLVLNPADVIRNASVDAGVATAGATLAETDHALQNVALTFLENQRATGISLARVFATASVAGAQHFLGSDCVESAVTGSAGLVGEGRNTDLHQNARRVVGALAGVTPTGDCSLNVVRNGFARRRQASRLGGRREFDGRRQFDDGDIVDVGGGIVVGVRNGGVDRDFLLTRLGFVQVVRAGCGGQNILHIVNAMGGRDHDVRLFDVANADQGAAANVGAEFKLQGNYPRMGIGAGFHAADDTLSVGVETTVRTHADGLAASARLTSGAVDHIFEGRCKSQGERRRQREQKERKFRHIDY